MATNREQDHCSQHVYLKNYAYNFKTINSVHQNFRDKVT